VTPEGGDDRFVLKRQDGRLRLGPGVRSAVEIRFFHLATVSRLTPWRLARNLRLF